MEYSAKIKSTPTAETLILGFLELTAHRNPSTENQRKRSRFYWNNLRMSLHIILQINKRIMTSWYAEITVTLEAKTLELKPKLQWQVRNFGTLQYSETTESSQILSIKHRERRSLTLSPEWQIASSNLLDLRCSMTQRMSIVFIECSIKMYYTKRRGGRLR